VQEEVSVDLALQLVAELLLALGVAPAALSASSKP
jgi:hypothetical protein